MAGPLSFYYFLCLSTYWSLRNNIVELKRVDRARRALFVVCLSCVCRAFDSRPRTASSTQGMRHPPRERPRAVPRVSLRWTRYERSSRAPSCRPKLQRLRRRYDTFPSPAAAAAGARRRRPPCHIMCLCEQCCFIFWGDTWSMV